VAVVAAAEGGSKDNSTGVVTLLMNRRPFALSEGAFFILNNDRVTRYAGVIPR